MTFDLSHLSPLARAVTQDAATEPPFSSALNEHFAEGVYKCVVCGAALFGSADKFRCGCGWPAFSKPVDSGRVVYAEDRSHGMERTEVRCAGCGAHLGHVFPDGPAPLHTRFCINGCCLVFQGGEM